MRWRNVADPTIISAAISGLLGVAGGGALASWRKAGAESESVAVATMRAVIGELRVELDHKEVELDRQRDEIDRQRVEIGQLRDRLTDAENALSEPPPHLA